jgi:hypothetical protein
MLGWFQRHQKSLMLILLTPALLAMGITGAVMSVMQNPGEEVAGRIFGSEVNLSEFQNIRRMFQVTSPQSEEEEAWRFYAQLKYAELNGIDVSKLEVGRDIRNTMRFSIAQSRALEELRKQKVDIRSKEGQRKFQQIYFRYVLNDKVEWNEKEYEQAVRLRTQGMNVREYETQEVREAKVLRLFDILKSLGTVSPTQVWEKYQDENHLRSLDLVEISAATYTPKLDAKKGEKAFVTKEEIELYYQVRKEDYDEPRRVKLAFLGVVFKDAEGEVDAPEEDALKAFNEDEGIAPVASFSEFEDKIRDAWFAARAKERVETIMDAVATRIEKAKLDKETPDLAAIAKAVKAELKTEVLLEGATPLSPEGELDNEDLLAGFAAKRWFRTGQVDLAKETFDTSDVLGGEKGWYVLQTREVKFARTPPYADIQDQVRRDFSLGSEAERKAYYEGHKSDYQLAEAWVIEAVLAKDEAFEKDHDKAKQALDKALGVARKWKKGFSLKKFETDPDVPQLETQDWERLTRAEFDKDPILKGVATELSTAKRGWLSPAFEYKGGWAAYRLVKKLAPDVEPFEDVEQKVAEAVGLERAVDRAELACAELLGELRHKRGEALAIALKKLALSPKETEPFARTATSLEGVADAGRLVSEAFSAEAEVGGSYQAVVPDPAGKRVFLVRVAKRVDAAEDGYSEHYATIRKDLLSKTRMDYAEREKRGMLLLAKGITPELVAYATETRDGPNGETRITFRQIFLPPDRTILDAWLEGQASSKLKQAQQALAAGKKWGSVVDEYSEHDATRRHEGELPEASRDDLANAFGIDFVEGVFNLPKGVVSPPVKSKLGLHLVRLVNVRGEKKVFQHIMIKTDAVSRSLPEEVRKQAEAASQAAMQKAVADIAAGKSFAEVAQTFGDPRDPYGQGQELEIDFVTHLERAALGQFLAMEAPEGHAGEGDPAWVPDVVEVPGPKGPTYHLFACERQRDNQGGLENTRWQDRKVYHVASSKKSDIEEVRSDLVGELKSLADKDEDRSWFTLKKLFTKLASDESQVVTSKKGGALGTMSLPSAVKGYGEAFLKSVAYTADGKPVATGTRSEIFRSEAGFHLVEIVKVETLKADDPARFSVVAEQLLAGTDWK